NRYVTGRGGGKIELVDRGGKWVCPRSGPSLAREFGEDVGTLAAGMGAMPVLALPTPRFTVGGGWLLGRLLRCWRREAGEQYLAAITGAASAVELVAARRGKMRASARLEAGIDTADGLGDAGPAMLGSPADALAPHAGPQIAIVEHARDPLGECGGIAFGHEIARDPLAHGRRQAAHA